ncbi:potassium channel subfamily K, other eukaryote [Geosmithia morbida]|uniref:Potassium channel subfamily K, other eukaryote n=1 Tax=Geosmithia morbida TaxID=1094350 RepID=A0A9P4YS36_9HYPO|nr:potassium channel subfamily K, other eukaryote [Geosmithia morbida]KAF4122093.1 potassium channel subfamily K, other eukaryote [Geosmithia morbida]
MENGGPVENVEQVAQHVDKGHPTTHYSSQKDNVHLEPSRWWFASSAFPMIAGTLGPVASAFSICALAQPWRQCRMRAEAAELVGFINDPAWLIAVNAIQLVVALGANLSLLLNMARVVRFSVAQPVTIAGWYVSAVLLLSLNATATGPLHEGFSAACGDDGEPIWSQAFFYGIWAAVLYFVMASLMAITFWGAVTGHYDREFRLNTSQRTLMLQTILLLVYLLVGALVFSNIEPWSYLDAVYWADVTLFTVGFGDFAASTTLGRTLLFPYALVGVMSLGLVIASIRSMILQRGRRRLDARAQEKERREVLRAMASRGQDSVLHPIHDDDGGGGDDDEGSRPRSRASNRGRRHATEYDRRRAEFELMRSIQAKAITRRRWLALVISTGSWLVLWLVGAAVFLELERPYQHWNYFDAFYFGFVTLTTIGYGDRTPISNAGKSFFVFWSLLALPTMTVLISSAEDTVVKFIRDATLQLGNLTILPGDARFQDNLMHVISRISCGALFRDNYVLSSAPHPADFPLDPDAASVPPDQEHDNDSTRQHRRRREHRRDLVDVERGRGRPSSTLTSEVRRSIPHFRDPLADLPGGTDFHFLLISEIQILAQHMREPVPRRYSFEEWAWYLRLLGQDERNPRHHKKPAVARRRLHKVNKGAVVEKDKDGSPDDDGSRWSWVGDRSPLMGSQEESEWISERLTDRLRESLSAQRRRQWKKYTHEDDG